jgi:hypothetical protein
MKMLWTQYWTCINQVSEWPLEVELKKNEIQRTLNIFAVFQLLGNSTIPTFIFIWNANTAVDIEHHCLQCAEYRERIQILL